MVGRRGGTEGGVQSYSGIVMSQNPAPGHKERVKTHLSPWETCGMGASRQRRALGHPSAVSTRDWKDVLLVSRGVPET